MPWVDFSQAAFTLGVSERTIRNWIKSGKLQARSAPGGRREVEIPEPNDPRAAHAFADDEGEEANPLDTQKRLEVALIECGRVKGTLASQERIMENLSANIAELNAKLHKSERVISRRTLYCVLVAAAGVVLLLLSRSVYDGQLREVSSQNETKLSALKQDQLKQEKEQAEAHSKDREKLREELNKQRIEELSSQASTLETKARTQIDDLKTQFDKMLADYKSENEKLRGENDKLRIAKTQIEAEAGTVKKELETAEARRAEAERQTELQKARVQELEKTRQDLENQIVELRKGGRR